MRATVLVRPKEGILDPQGQAVEEALRHLGFHVGHARVGRVVDLEVAAADPAEIGVSPERRASDRPWTSRSARASVR